MLSINNFSMKNMEFYNFGIQESVLDRRMIEVQKYRSCINSTEIGVDSYFTISNMTFMNDYNQGMVLNNINTIFFLKLTSPLAGVIGYTN